MSKGRILHLQRLSTEDGPGIRTTVFFKGCPLRCAWCHNPESISPLPQVQWHAKRCLGCETCLGVCPRQSLSRRQGRLVIDRQTCDGCGVCADACPSNAIERLGIWMGSDTLLSELLKDRTYYEKSGGGVTLSGGEPGLQPDFALDVLVGLKQASISTALDTCGLCSRQTLEKLLPYTDLVLYDLKLIDAGAHRRATGQSNEVIFANLVYLCDLIEKHELTTRIWIRTPLIPGTTDDDRNLLGIGAWIAQNLDGRVERWELCAFNNLCRDKYTRLDLEWIYDRTPLMAAGDLARCETTARASGVDAEMVMATGATRLVAVTQE